MIKEERRIYLNNFEYPDKRYEIFDKLGEGGTAQVFLAKHKKLGITRAIKSIPKNDKNAECYYAEINVLNRVKLKGVPIIYDVDEDYDNWYIVEEYIEGVSFRKIMDEGNEKIVNLMEYICELCDVIDTLHSIKPYGLIYNDLKPENIIVSKNGVYIVDFGNSVLLDERDRVYQMASKEYASPEQLAGLKPGVWTDVYSIGVLIQKLYKKYQNDFKEWEHLILKVISRCMSRDYKARFTSMKAVSSEIKKIIHSQDEYRIPEQEHNVYVYGCRRYAGTTHFALGLSKYMAETASGALYIEDKSFGGILELLEDAGDIDYRNGVYMYENCRMSPNYGGFCMENDESKETLHIYDCGMYQGDMKRLNGTVIVVITDIKNYLKVAFDEIEEDSKGNNIVYVANFSNDKGIRKLLKEYGIDAIKMPFFDNPFVLEGEALDFYKRVVDKITSNNISSKQLIKKGGYR